MEEKVILIIDDEPIINRIITKSFTQEGHKVLSAPNGHIGLDLFKSNKIDLVCLDIMMPELNGWEVAKTIREISQVPIIVMSVLNEEEDILKGYSLHVDDYITKPFNPSILLAKARSLFNRIEIERKSSDSSEEYDMGLNSVELTLYGESDLVKELLAKDELTGIPNRRFLNFHIANLIKQTTGFYSTFGILFLDIDHFKKVNDTYGHNVGDYVLQELSHIIRISLRNNDVVGRWGGEEFLAVINVDNTQKLSLIAEKLRAIIEKHNFETNDISLNITISIGGSLYQNDETIDEVIDRADTNMYESKNNGRNKVTIK